LTQLTALSVIPASNRSIAEKTKIAPGIQSSGAIFVILFLV
jgi:hypothetical protein